jgi:hypothetical protein
VGRTAFETGIGTISYAACEMLARSFPTCILPTDRPPTDAAVSLPNGRAIPVCTDLERPEVFFYADILWNGAADHTLGMMPARGLRIAHVCFDSDELPTEWVRRLNERFDIALFPTPEQGTIADSSGVRIPMGTLPIALPLEDLLVQPFEQNPSGLVRFGCIASYHERKELELLIRCFLDEFQETDEVELVVHSNLAFGSVFDQLQRYHDPTGRPAVRLSREPLEPQDRDALVQSMDVFVSCSRGEGYSIGPREALALGKALVLSDIHAHRPLLGLSGVFGIPATVPVPARYEEIDGRTFGQQWRVQPRSVCRQLRYALEFVRSPDHRATQRGRRAHAAAVSFSSMSPDYARLVDPEIERFRLQSPDSPSWLPREAAQCARTKLGGHADRLHCTNRLTVPAHDGGFFSVFNTFMSFLVWGLPDDRCHMVLPDWDQQRMTERLGSSRRSSFCYGRPEDGNIWTLLFEPLYGLDVADLDSDEFLYARSTTPTTWHNEDREPLLTFANAYDLYRSRGFVRFRRQYHDALQRHISPLAGLQEAADQFVAEHMAGRYVIAAHVKHPSHLVEQPGRAMPTLDRYVHDTRLLLRERGLSEASEDWALFVATDQSSVVDYMHELFGERVLAFSDVRRSSSQEDALYDPSALTSSDVTHAQVQHFVAASPDSWSTTFAEEVLRDALVMSQASTLLHVVSNVATAVSYFNPSIEMRLVTP